jgi:hypothetical protein
MLPNLIVIGATSAGTTALYHYLGEHPEISMSREKELRFFLEEINWGNGREWYESQFTNGSAQVCGEASPQYTRFPDYLGVPERMYSLVPGAKLIYLVRDPIERIVSAYVDNRSTGQEDRSLAEAVTEPAGNLYVSESSYYMQLERYLERFPGEQILVVKQEDLLRQRRPTLRNVFRFLGVDESFDSPRFDKIRNSSRGKRRVENQPRWLSKNPYPRAVGWLPWEWRARAKRLLYSPFLTPIERPAVGEAVREALIRRLKPDVDELRRVTGMAFEDWSV